MDSGHGSKLLGAFHPDSQFTLKYLTPFLPAFPLAVGRWANLRQCLGLSFLGEMEIKNACHG